METQALQSVYDQLIKGIKKYFKKTGFHRAVVGVSGGVDSSLTLKLAVDALGAENVTAVSLPELGVSSQENIDHAKGLCKALNVAFFYQPINPFLTDFYHLPWDPNKLATQNTKARIRAVLLYNYANTADALVLGTSNKSETLLGYSQLDPILKRIKLGPDKLIERGVNPMLVHAVLKRVEKNKHKTEMPPIIKLKMNN